MKYFYNVIVLISILLPVQSVLAVDSLKSAPKEVTVLIYYSGDNRLSDFMHSSYLRVLREGASSDVNVVVQYDGEKKNDSFRVQVGSEKKNSKYTERFFAKNIEYDMGNPQTLVDFVKWGKANFPAKRTVLVISSHGFGILNNPYPESDKIKKSKTVGRLASSIDDSSHSYMKEEQMVDQLKKALGGQKLDLLVHNSCLMGSLESLSIMAGIAKYAIASEYSIYMNKSDDLVNNEARTILIENIVSQLKKNPSVAEQEIGHQVVTDFEINYKNFKFPSVSDEEVRLPSTMAFYDLQLINALALKYSEISKKFMQKAISDQSALARLFDENLKARYIDSFGYVDIRTLYKGLVAAVYPDAMTSQMNEFDQLMNKVVPEKVALFTGQTEQIAHLHVFFPSILEVGDIKPYFKTYGDIKLVRDYGFPQFLSFFWKQFDQNSAAYWMAKLKDWNSGATIIVKPTAAAESYDYELFLALSMVATRLNDIPGKADLKKYSAYLDTLTRVSADLDDQRKYVKGLLNP